MMRQTARATPTQSALSALADPADSATPISLTDPTAPSALAAKSAPATPNEQLAAQAPAYASGATTVARAAQTDRQTTCRQTVYPHHFCYAEP